MKQANYENILSYLLVCKFWGYLVLNFELYSRRYLLTRKCEEWVCFTDEFETNIKNKEKMYWNFKELKLLCNLVYKRFSNMGFTRQSFLIREMFSFQSLLRLSFASDCNWNLGNYQKAIERQPGMKECLILQFWILTVVQEFFISIGSFLTFIALEWVTWSSKFHTKLFI